MRPLPTLKSPLPWNWMPPLSFFYSALIAVGNNHSCMFPSGLVPVPLDLKLHSGREVCLVLRPFPGPSPTHKRQERNELSEWQSNKVADTGGPLHPWHSMILLYGVDPQTLWVHMLCRTVNFWVALEAVRILGEGRGLRVYLVKSPHFTSKNIKTRDL